MPHTTVPWAAQLSGDGTSPTKPLLMLDLTSWKDVSTRTIKRDLDEYKNVRYNFTLETHIIGNVSFNPVH